MSEEKTVDELMKIAGEISEKYFIGLKVGERILLCSLLHSKSQLEMDLQAISDISENGLEEEKSTKGAGDG